MPINKTKYNVVGSTRQKSGLYLILKDKKTHKIKLDKRDCKCPKDKKKPCKC